MSSAVITGLGIVSPLGVGIESFWSRLLEGAAVSETPRRTKPGVPVPGEVFLIEAGFEPERWADARTLRKVSELTRLVTVAATLCLDDARFPREAEWRDETGVSLGTAFGSSGYHLEYHEALRRHGPKCASALLFTQSVFNAASGHLCQIHGLRGSNMTLVGGETAGLDAIAAAADRIHLGLERALLAGGAEEYDPLVHASIHATGLVGSRSGEGALAATPAPFAEGAALVMVEESAAATARAASCRAEIAGSGRARAIGALSRAGAVRRAATRACEEAGIEPARLDLVVSGAAGGPHAAAEIAALGEMLETSGSAGVLSAPKGFLGEGFGATSSALVVIGTLALERGVVPPSAAADRDAAPAGIADRLPIRPEAKALSHVLIVGSTRPGSVTALLLRRPLLAARA